MLFWSLYFWFSNGVRLWFRKVYVHFEEPIPEGVPIIFACTHPNSAIDYVFVPLITKRKTFVLVRGDVFEKKWLNAFFRGIWMLPVYRFRDGYSSLNKNSQSFEECYQQFDKNGRVLIFSEGVCVQRKELQPLKKGTARLALDYLNAKEGREVYVVPVANNYSKFRTFRATVMTNFGKPIKASSYKELFAQNPNQAYVKLTNDIQDSLARNFIEPKDYEDGSIAEKALEVLRLNRKEGRKEWAIQDQSPFIQEKTLTEKMNRGDVKLDDQWLKEYQRLNISERDEGMLKASKRPDFHLMVLFAMSMLIAMAQVLHFLPHRLARWIVKAKINDVIFENTVMVMGSTVIYMVQFFILLGILWRTMGWPGVVIACSTIAVSIIYIEVIDEYRFAWKNWRKVKNREAYKRLYAALGL